MFAYHCSDICPDYGGVSFTYTNVSEDECCKLEGLPLRDPAWGGYRGCSPPEAMSRFGVLLRTPDDEYHHLVSSGCPGRDPIILEEWACEPPIAERPGLGLTRGPLPPRVRYAPDIKRHPDTSCPKTFDGVRAEQALRVLDGQAMDCLSRLGPGVARIRVRFAPTGRATTAWLAYPPRLNNSEGRCIETVYQKAVTEPFRGESAEAWHELRLGLD
jgi:hypothetical protein